MKIVSVINYKGGVGKTSLTANLGAELARRAKRILLIDLDAQASLTFSFVRPDDWNRRFASDRTIKAWFDAYENGKSVPLKRLIISPERISENIPRGGCLHLICSHLGLINVDLELATKLGAASLQQAKKNFISVHRRLADGLAELASEASYDVVLIDCPPNFNIVTKTAIVASDYILVPTRPDELSTMGIDFLMRSIRELIDNYNDFADLDTGTKEAHISPKILGVVFTMIQEYGSGPISAQRNYIAKVRRGSGLPVFSSYIKRNDTLFSDAPLYGVPVVLREHNSNTYQSVVSGLEAVATEFAEKLGV